MPGLTPELVDVLERLKDWPPERQNDVAATLGAMLEQGDDVYPLRSEEETRLTRSQDQVRRGEVASDDDVRRVLGKHGL